MTQKTNKTYNYNREFYLREQKRLLAARKAKKENAEKLKREAIEKFFSGEKINPGKNYKEYLKEQKQRESY